VLLSLMLPLDFDVSDEAVRLHVGFRKWSSVHRHILKRYIFHSVRLVESLKFDVQRICRRAHVAENHPVDVSAFRVTRPESLVDPE